MSTEEQADGAPSSASDAGLKIWSCVTCRRRKVRCDRRDPCSNCVRAAIDCHYPVTGRVPRRSRDPSVWKSPAQKQSELLSRLRRLEAVVTELSAQVEEGPGEPSANPASDQPNPSLSVSGNTSSPDTTQSEARSVGQSLTSSASDALSFIPGSEFDEEFGRLVVDKDGSRHVGNRFWSVFCDEVDNILQAVHDVADYNEPNDSTIPETAPSGNLGHQGFVFGHGASSGSLDALNPLPSQMLFIWQTFVERVDIFIKILHVPTMDKVIRELKGNFSSLSPSMEPLLFAISLAAIVSMDDEAVATNFNAPKAHLLARYRLGTEQALGQAEFLVTKQIVVVQAFVIYLSVLPHIGAGDSAWPLTGLLIRVAKSLGLHQNQNNKSQLETELRRRLWWHICFLDSKTQRPCLRDLSISETSFDTELPGTTDDTQLDSLTSTAALPDIKSSNMIPCLVRCGIWRVVQALQANSTNTPQIKLQIFQAAKSKIQSNYLQGLRSELALDSFITTLVSLFFAKVELVLHRPLVSAKTQTSCTPHSQHYMFSALKASITIIKAVHALITEPTWVNWRWQLAGHVPWHAIGVFLRQACRQPWGLESEQVWITTKGLLESASADAKKASLWLPLVGLAKTTETYREGELTRWKAETLGGQPLPALPVDQWVDKIAETTDDNLSFPTNQLHDMVIEPQACNSRCEPTLETPTILQAESIPQSSEPLGSLLGNQPSGLHFQSANPTLWSPLAEVEALGQIEPSNLTQPDEASLMDWDIWEAMRGVEPVWDLF